MRDTMNQKKLSERKVLITAASSGIGFAIASVLAEKGAAVFMTSEAAG
jgi:NAD(P)-dependent dehydrogenase (short-subunit alcohol dehydrogenase family)